MKRFLATIMIIALCLTLLSLGTPTVKAETGTTHQLTNVVMDDWYTRSADTGATTIGFDVLFTDLADGDTIKLSESVGMKLGEANDYTAPYFVLNKENATVTLDLAGHTLTGCDRRQLIEVTAGTLIVIDTGSSGGIINEENYHGGNATIRANGGTVTIESGNFVGSSALAINKGTLNINGGNLQGRSCDLNIASDNSYATVNVNADDTVKGFKFGQYALGEINVNADTTITQYNGDWRREYMRINVGSNSTLTISNSVTVNNLNLVINVDSGSKMVNDGTFNNSGEINVAGGGNFTNNGHFTNKERITGTGDSSKTWKGTLNIAYDGRVANTGEFINSTTAITNDGVFTNDGSIIEQTQEIGWLVGVKNNKFISIYGSQFEGTAASANTYTVLGVDANSPTYIITIPSEVKLYPSVNDYQNNAYSQEFDVCLTNAVLGDGAAVSIAVNETDPFITLDGNSEVSLPYTVKWGDLVLEGDAKCTFDATEPCYDSQTATLSVVFDLKNQLRIAGTYTGTITFTCSYVQGATP